MKKTISIIICLSMLCLMFGCTVKPKNEDACLNIVCTIFPPYDFSTIVGGEHVSVTQLLPAGAESHSYEPSAKDIIAVQDCDLFIYVGGVNDLWASDILDSMGDNAPRTLALLDCVEVVPEQIVEGMESEEEEHGEQGDVEMDEHVWTDPNNAIAIVRAIEKEFSELDAEHSSDFEAAADEYVVKLQQLDAGFRELMATATRKTIVIGDRFPFRYLARAYGLEYYAAFPGCSTEVEPSVSTVAFLIDKVESENIPVVFYIEFSNQKIANTIAEPTGAKTLLLHSCHNISKTEREAGTSYLSLMEQNLANLKEALLP